MKRRLPRDATQTRPLGDVTALTELTIGNFITGLIDTGIERNLMPS
jgi:hypothetical protein